MIFFNILYLLTQNIYGGTMSSYIEQGLLKTNNFIAIKQDSLDLISDFLNNKLAEFLNLPTNTTIQNVDFSSVSSVFSLITSTVIILSFSVAALWLIRAYSLYTLAKKQNIPMPYLAFIPYACLYITGKIVKKLIFFGIEIDKPEYTLLILIISMYLPYSAAISLPLFIFIYNSFMFRIYKLYSKRFAFLIATISCFIPIIQPVFLFFMRNNIRKYEYID